MREGVGWPSFFDGLRMGGVSLQSFERIGLVDEGQRKTDEDERESQQRQHDPASGRRMSETEDGPEACQRRR
jgi:hypothetical protein